jgi:hypothetical protein
VTEFVGKRKIPGAAAFIHSTYFRRNVSYFY